VLRRCRPDSALRSGSGLRSARWSALRQVPDRKDNRTGRDSGRTAGRRSCDRRRCRRLASSRCRRRALRRRGCRGSAIIAELVSAGSSTVKKALVASFPVAFVGGLECGRGNREVPGIGKAGDHHVAKEIDGQFGAGARSAGAARQGRQQSWSVRLVVTDGPSSAAKAVIGTSTSPSNEIPVVLSPSGRHCCSSRIR
jgi:hypothetical protein